MSISQNSIFFHRNTNTHSSNYDQRQEISARKRYFQLRGWETLDLNWFWESAVFFCSGASSYIEIEIEISGSKTKRGWMRDGEIDGNLLRDQREFERISPFSQRIETLKLMKRERERRVRNPTGNAQTLITETVSYKLKCARNLWWGHQYVVWPTMDGIERFSMMLTLDVCRGGHRWSIKSIYILHKCLGN